LQSLLCSGLIAILRDGKNVSKLQPSKMKYPKITRRAFLGLASAGCAALTLGPMGCAMQRSRKSKLRILFYTDVHAIAEREAPIAMQRAVGVINDQNADLIFNGGDLIHQGYQLSEQAAQGRWDIYMDMHEAIKGEIFSTLGNHDLVAVRPKDGSPPNQDPKVVFLDRLGLERSYYSFDALGYHFVVLDSVQTKTKGKVYKGWIDDEQVYWLKEDVAMLSPLMPIVIVTHIPLLTNFYLATEGTTQPTPNTVVIGNNVEILKVFEGYNLRLVLQGHTHVDELIRWRGVSFITGGAICGAWWRGPRLGTEEGFGMVTLSDEDVSWEYIDYGWEAKRRKKPSS
jgi:3',5'-cyclic AMP phosphodiesterase CpdA